MNKTLSQSHYLIHAYYPRLVRALSGAVILLVAVYATFLVQTVNAVSVRKSLRTDIKSSQARISDLETKYFELANAIDTTRVHELGFQEIANPVFAYTYPVHETPTESFAVNVTGTFNKR